MTRLIMHAVGARVEGQSVALVAASFLVMGFPFGLSPPMPPLS